MKWMLHYHNIVKEEDVRFLKNALGEEATDEKVRGVLSTK